MTKGRARLQARQCYTLHRTRASYDVADTPRDFFRELSVVALFRRWLPGRLFLILTAHMDESGTHGGSPITVMGGALATANQWDKFQSGLDKLKRRYGFKIFHTTDFKARQGEFKDWSNEKCVMFLRDFMMTSSGLMEVVTCSLPNAAYEQNYRRKNADPRKLRLDTAYALCFRYCLMHLLLEAVRRLGNHKKFPVTRLHVIAESGHRHAGDAKRCFDELKHELASMGNRTLGNLTFAAKDDCDPLMLADYLATGTFQLELAGRNNAPESGELSPPPDPRVTGWTQVTFEPDGLTSLKAILIERLAAMGGGASAARPEASSP